MKISSIKNIFFHKRWINFQICSIGFLVGALLQQRWYKVHCFDQSGDMIKNWSGCAFYPIRIPLGGLLISIALFSILKGLSCLITQVYKTPNTQNIYSKLANSISLIGLYLFFPFIDYRFHKPFITIIFVVIIISILISFFEELVLVTKIFFKKKGYNHLFLISFIIALGSELFISIFTENSIFNLTHRANEFFIYNTFIVFCLFTLMFFLLNRFYLTIYLSSGVIALLIFAHIKKIQILSEPLYPWDYDLIDECFKILGRYLDNLTLYLFVPLVGLCFLSIFIYIFIKEKPLVNIFKRSNS